MIAVDNTSYAFFASQTSYYSVDFPEWKSIGGKVDTIEGGAAAIGPLIYVVGGANFGQNCSVFSTKTLSFASCTPLPTGRGLLGVAAIGHILYAIGGYAEPGWDTVESLNTLTNTWATGLLPLPTPRYGLTAVTLNGTIYAIGGSAYQEAAVTTVEIFDPVANTWTTGPSLMSRRAYAASAVLDNVIYVAGGNDGTYDLQSIEYLTLGASSWQSGPQLLSPPRSHFGLSALPGYLVAAGGSIGTGNKVQDTTQVEAVDV